jgi:chaperonin GroES
MRGYEKTNHTSPQRKQGITPLSVTQQSLARAAGSYPVQYSFISRRKPMPATATPTKKKSAPAAKVTLQPLGDKVVVEREESEEKTKGGIYIPDAAKDKPTRGTIIAVGTGKLLDDGTRGPMQVKKGDRVLFTSYAPETIKIGEEEYLLMSETDILAVIE